MFPDIHHHVRKLEELDVEVEDRCSQMRLKAERLADALRSAFTMVRKADPQGNMEDHYPNFDKTLACSTLADHAQRLLE